MTSSYFFVNEDSSRHIDKDMLSFMNRQKTIHNMFSTSRFEQIFLRDHDWCNLPYPKILRFYLYYKGVPIRRPQW